MAARSASIARSAPLRSFLKNVLCNELVFYSQAHFQTRAARGQAPLSAWERGLGSAGHALVYPRHMAAIREGRFWAARCVTAFQLRGRENIKVRMGAPLIAGSPGPPIRRCYTVPAFKVCADDAFGGRQRLCATYLPKMSDVTYRRRLPLRRAPCQMHH